MSIIDMPSRVKQYAPVLDDASSRRALAYFLTCSFCPAYSSGYVAYLLSQPATVFDNWAAQFIQLHVVVTGQHRVCVELRIFCDK